MPVRGKTGLSGRANVDFKKIKRKIGRRLPLPRNATNTAIKSKAIVLPEQSITCEKDGLAVNKKGLTLKELLQQTSHHNAKVRLGAVQGLKDLFMQHPPELDRHKYAITERIRERICDDNKLVREVLYQLLKTNIFPCWKSDDQRLIVSLLIPYIFNAMTHLSIEIRLMAFKYLEVVIHYYPHSVFLFHEKILQNYESILHRSNTFLLEMGTMKNPLTLLVECLSVLTSKKSYTSAEKAPSYYGCLLAYEFDDPSKCTEAVVIKKKLGNFLPILISCFQDFISIIFSSHCLDAQSFGCVASVLKCIDLILKFLGGDFYKHQKTLASQTGVMMHHSSATTLDKLFSCFPLSSSSLLSEKDGDRYFILNAMLTKIFMDSSNLTQVSAQLPEKFLMFILYDFPGKICGNTKRSKPDVVEHVLPIIHSLPEFLLTVNDELMFQVLQAFTVLFESCKPDSLIKLACLNAIERIITDDRYVIHRFHNPILLNILVTWLAGMPQLLLQPGMNNPSASQVGLSVILHYAQCCAVRTDLLTAYENIQPQLAVFFATFEENPDYGPFVKLPKEVQEIAISTLSYFCKLDQELLKSLSYCCLCSELDPHISVMIISTLQSSFKKGHIDVADFASFLITVAFHFNVFPRNVFACDCDPEVSNHGAFKSILNVVCQCFSELGDGHTVFQLIESFILGKLLAKLPLDNQCVLLSILATLRFKPAWINAEDVISLDNFVSNYMENITRCLSQADASRGSMNAQNLQFYLAPCYHLFRRCHKFLHNVLAALQNLVKECFESQQASPSRAIDAVLMVWDALKRDARVQKLLPLVGPEIDNILCTVSSLTSSAAGLSAKERMKNGTVDLLNPLVTA